MKRTKSNLLGVLALALAGMGGSFLAAAPAQAAVSCPIYPSPVQTTWPKNGHIYNCMPTPRNSAETALQAQILNTAAIGGNLNTNAKTKLNAKNVDIIVAYTAVDAFAKAGITPGVGGEKPIGAGESGRSWVFTNTNATLVNPTTAVFVYTQTQWNAIPGTPKIPTSYVGSQLTGTVHHELGHQLDRIWAQYLGYTPTATAVITGTAASHFGVAVNVDGAQLTPADITTIQNNYPRLLIDPPPASPVLNFNEIFAEQVAINAGGGANSAEDTFINAKFRCSTWLVTQMYTNGGTPPASPPNPTGTICNHITSW